MYMCSIWLPYLSQNSHIPVGSCCLLQCPAHIVVWLGILGHCNSFLSLSQMALNHQSWHYWLSAPLNGTPVAKDVAVTLSWHYLGFDGLALSLTSTTSCGVCVRACIRVLKFKAAHCLKNIYHYMQYYKKINSAGKGVPTKPDNSIQSWNSYGRREPVTTSWLLNFICAI